MPQGIIYKIIYNLNFSSKHRNYTSMPHPPGSVQNERLGEEIAAVWGEHVDKMEQFKHNIYLSYPTAPGEITLHQDVPNGFNETKLLIENEPVFDESEQNNDKLLYPFNAFSPSGLVTVYL